MEGYLTPQQYIAKNNILSTLFDNYKTLYKTLSRNMQLHRFPVAAHTQDAFLSKLEMALSFAILFSYIFISMNTVKVNVNLRNYLNR